MPTIGSNIISTLGSGSGINSTSIAEQLTEIERAPSQTRIDDKRDLYDTQLSDLGLLKNALSTLQDAANVLSDANTFKAKSATYNESTILIPQELDESAATGSYAFKVDQLASAHTLALDTSLSFSDPTDAVGKGSLTFSFGEWVDSDTFTTNAEKSSFTITIDDSNNSLNGLRDAINNADAGVQASILNDGANGYRLVLTADSGLSNQMRIEAAEDELTPSNNDNTGLSRFSFIEGASNQQLAQLQTGLNAEFTVNGLDVVRDTNLIDDVIDGFKFTLAKEKTGETFTIDITQDIAIAQQAVRDFVTTYNEFFDAIEPLVGRSEDENGNIVDGSFYRDATANSLLNRLKTTVSAQVNKVEGSFSALTNLGIRTERDGSLSINEDDFSRAFNNNYTDILQLFAPATSSSSDKIMISKFGSQTQAGSYDIQITTAPSQGTYTGALAAADLLNSLTTPSSGYLTGELADTNLLTTLSTAGGNDFDFSLTVDGTASNVISLTPGVYANQSDLANEIANQINNDAALFAAGKTVSVTWEGDRFVIASNASGISSEVTNFTYGPLANNNNLNQLGFVSPVASPGAGADNPVDFSFSITVDGVASNTINLNPGNFSSETEIADYLTQLINGDENLSSSNASVNVSWNSNSFVVTSSRYGSASSVAFTAIGAEFADLGLTTGVATNGNDVVGTINGEAAFGAGNVLLPPLDSPAYGMSFIVNENATSSTVNFSRGFGGTFSQTITPFLQSNGVLDLKEDSINQGIDRLDTDQSNLDRRMESFYARLQAQFLAMERIISGFSASGSFLDGLVDRLPFTQSSQ